MKYKLSCEVWVSDNEVIILGTPASEESKTTEEEERALHNCDAMGCGCAHVLYRAPATEQIKAAAREYGDLESG